MSDVFEQENKKPLNNKKNHESYIENQQILNDKEGIIDPSSLLSKDLLNQINSLEDTNFGEKKQNGIDHFQLNDAKKESEENKEEDDYILEIEKMDKESLGFEEKKKSNENINKINNNQNKGIFSQPIPYYKQININSSNPNDELNNSPLFLGRLSYDFPSYQNNHDNFNGLINNSLQNQLNFFNNSFTKNGKSGWICAFCKNFNYESKHIQIFIIFLK